MVKVHPRSAGRSPKIGARRDSLVPMKYLETEGTNEEKGCHDADDDSLSYVRKEKL